jgi:hypothetical protein
VRVEQNWIGVSGLSPAGAEFIPPPPELVDELVHDLVAFLNRDDFPRPYRRRPSTPSSRRSTRSSAAGAAAEAEVERQGALEHPPVGRDRDEPREEAIETRSYCAAGQVSSSGAELREFG